MKTLAKEKLKQMIEDNEDFVLINVLAEEYFDQEHIPGSINIPIKDEDFVDKVKARFPDKSKKIVVHCSSFECQASPAAAKKLADEGYKDVYDYEGGIKEWKEAGYGLESSK